MHAANFTVLAALLLVGCKAGQQTSSHEDEIVADKVVAADNEQLEQENRIVCIRQLVVGSLMKRPVCLPYRVWIERGHSLPPLTGYDSEPPE